MTTIRKYELDFSTATILEWKFLLANDAYKGIIIDSLRYLVHNKRVFVNAFVIMSNHIHILWQIAHPHKRADVQRDFLKFTAQMIIKDLRNNNTELLQEFNVNASGRKYQIWERNALSVDIWSESVLLQKLDYLHSNPVRAGICNNMNDYKYSSFRFYETGVDDFGFLSHYHYA